MPCQRQLLGPVSEEDRDLDARAATTIGYHQSNAQSNLYNLYTTPLRPNFEPNGLETSLHLLRSDTKVGANPTCLPIGMGAKIFLSALLICVGLKNPRHIKSDRIS